MTILNEIPRRVVLLLACIILLQPSLRAAPDRDTVTRIKQACALVLGKADGNIVSGSAFCIHPAGIFVTNRHVIEDAEPLILITAAGEENEQHHSVEVLRVVEDVDLALLVTKSLPEEPMEYLEIDDEADLFETQEIAAYGYPLGQSLSLNEGDSPQISVSMGRISSLRRIGEEIEVIQLDAAVIPGNSGGPIVSSDGRVIGVITAGLVGSNINFALPAEKISQLTEEALFYAPPLNLHPAEARKVRSFSALYVEFKAPEQTKELRFEAEAGGSSQSILLKPKFPGHYAADARLLPDKVGGELSITITKDGQSSIIKASDVEVEDPEIEQLSDIESFKAKPQPETVLRSGETVSGRKPNFGSVQAKLGVIDLEVDLNTFEEFTVDEAEMPPVNVSYSYTLVRDGQSSTLAKKSATISSDNESIDDDSPDLFVMGDEASGEGGQPLGRLQRLSLPAPIDDYMIAGAGRYWALWLSQIRKVALVDIESREISRYLNVPATNAMITAGASKVVAFLPDAEVFVVYDIETGERLLTKPKPFSGVIKGIVMGSASEGPIFACATQGTEALSRGGYKLIDLGTLQERKFEWEGRSPTISYRDQVNMRVNPEGNALTWFKSRVSPSGVSTMRIIGEQAVYANDHTSEGYVHPTGFEGTIVTGTGAIYSADLTKLSDSRTIKGPLIPAYCEPYFLQLTSPERRSGTTETKVTVHDFKSRQPLVSANVAINEVFGSYPSHYFDSDKRYFFSVGMSVLSWIPNGTRQVCFQTFNFFKKMDDIGIDYLLVTSVPPTGIEAGQGFAYQIEAKSNRPPLNFNLDTGPSGMKISESGLIEWAVPANVDAPVFVVVTISNASGESTFHTFSLEASL